MLYKEQMFCYNYIRTDVREGDRGMKRKRIRIANKFRFTVFMVIVSLIIISSAGTLIGLNTAESADIPEYIEVYVESGDTLWGLAQTHGPKNVDKRKIIYEVSKINNLSGDYIYPGEVLKFPVYE